MIAIAISLISLVLIYYIFSQKSDYEGKIQNLEYNLAEISMKISAIRDEAAAGKMKADSELSVIKRDIQQNMIDLVKSTEGLVSDEKFQKEMARINGIIEQSNTDNASKEDLASYKKEVYPSLVKLEMIGNQVIKLIDTNEVVNAELNKTAKTNDLENVKKLLESKIDSQIDELMQKFPYLDEVESSLRNSINLNNDMFNDKISEIETLVKKDAALTSDKIYENSKLINNLNAAQLKSIETFRTELEGKLLDVKNSAQSASQVLKLAIDDLSQMQTRALNDYIALNNSNMSKITKSIAESNSAIAEVKDSVLNINKLIGDVSNLKYIPVIKDNLLETIYDLNERLKKYENSTAINSLKETLEKVIKNIDTVKLQNNFWEYDEIFEVIVDLISAIDPKIKEANAPLLLELKEAMESAYKSKSSKLVVFMRVKNAIGSLRGVTDNRTVEYFQRLNNMMFNVQLPLSLADYVENLQKSVNILHSKRKITESDINLLNSQINSININMKTASVETTNSLSSLQKSVAELAIGNNQIVEIQAKLKALEAQSAQTMQSNENLKQVTNTVNYLSNVIGSWSDANNISIYIKAMNDDVKKNKASQDQILDSLNKLKSYVGEYALGQDKHLSAAVDRAQNTADRAKALIGNYDWNVTNNKPFFEYVSTIVSRINQIDIAIKSLDPTNSNNSIYELNTAIYGINQSIANMRETIPNKTFIDKSIDFLSTKAIATDKKLGFDPSEPRTVNQILKDMATEMTNMKSYLGQVDINRISITSLDNAMRDDRLYISRINEYVKTVESSLSLLTNNFTELSKNLDAVKSMTSTSNTNSLDINTIYTRLSDVNSRIEFLEKLTQRIKNDKPWWPLIHPLITLNKSLISLSTFIEVNSYQRLIVLAPIALQIVTSMNVDYSNFTFKKEYKDLAEFNNLVLSVWKTNLINLKLATTHGAYDTWANFAQYAKNVDYANAGAIDIAEPLWYFVQRKLTEVWDTFATKSSVNNLTTTITTTVTAIDTENKRNSAAVLQLSKDLLSLAAKIPTASAGSTMPTSGDITIPALFNVSSDPSDCYIFTNGHIVNGQLRITPYIFPNTTTAHGIDIQKLRTTGSTSVLPLKSTTVSFSDMYNIISGIPHADRVHMYNNAMSIVINYNQSKIYSQSGFLLGKKTLDTDIFVLGLASNIYTKTQGLYDSRSMPPVNTEIYTSLNYFKSHLVTNTGGTQVNPVREFVMIDKNDILRVMDSLIEFSRKYEATVSVSFGAYIYTYGDTKATEVFNYLKSSKIAAPPQTTRIFLDAVKSARYRTPTLVSNGLLDVSQEGIVLNNNATDFTDPSTISYAHMGRGYSNSYCAENSYMCGVQTTVGQGPFGVFTGTNPICCPFKKK